MSNDLIQKLVLLGKISDVLREIFVDSIDAEQAMKISEDLSPTEMAIAYATAGMCYIELEKYREDLAKVMRAPIVAMISVGMHVDDKINGKPRVIGDKETWYETVNGNLTVRENTPLARIVVECNRNEKDHANPIFDNVLGLCIADYFKMTLDPSNGDKDLDQLVHIIAQFVAAGVKLALRTRRKLADEQLRWN